VAILSKNLGEFLEELQAKRETVTKGLNGTCEKHDLSDFTTVRILS
jgi:hypothetical protein